MIEGEYIQPFDKPLCEEPNADSIDNKLTRIAMVLAAGLGTRLKPITDTMPKALVPYKGRPLLETLLLKLKRSGFGRVVINVHHFADQVEDFVRKNDGFGIQYSFSDERDLLRDTGGAIRYAEQHIGNHPFLVHNVDIVSDVDLRWLYETANQMLLPMEAAIPLYRPPIGVLLVSRRETARRLLFDENDRLVGWTNLSNGEVRSPYPEIASVNSILACQRYNALAYSGIQVVSPAIFPLMERWQESFSIIDFYLSIADCFVIKALEAPKDVKLTDVGKLSQVIDEII